MIWLKQFLTSSTEISLPSPQTNTNQTTANIDGPCYIQTIHTSLVTNDKKMKYLEKSMK